MLHTWQNKPATIIKVKRIVKINVCHARQKDTMTPLCLETSSFNKYLKTVFLNNTMHKIYWCLGTFEFCNPKVDYNLNCGKRFSLLDWIFICENCIAWSWNSAADLCFRTNEFHICMISFSSFVTSTKSSSICNPIKIVTSKDRECLKQIVRKTLTGKNC
jgi:hypothetical protein